MDFRKKIHIIGNNLFYFDSLPVNENKVTINFLSIFQMYTKKTMFIIRFHDSTMPCICTYVHIYVHSKIE